MTREDIREAVEDNIEYLYGSDVDNVASFLEAVAESIFDNEDILTQIAQAIREAY